VDVDTRELAELRPLRDTTRATIAKRVSGEMTTYTSLLAEMDRHVKMRTKDASDTVA
jgi:hypothetical protein